MTDTRPTTVFERVWNNRKELLFRSDRHEVLAAVDIKPKFPLQVVVALRYGTPGERADFDALPSYMKKRLHTVADFLGQKILANCTEEQRVIRHTEGFGVPDHPHITLFAAERGQGKDLYNGEPLGLEVVENTLKVLKFTDTQPAELEAELGQIY
ncbi:MAG: hypothetical protein JWL85_129 [Candidatus Saccharibacteria bacterium]|nr:hypothetical protein [Candidatus Saccharibacteria bacterium]